MMLLAFYEMITARLVLFNPFAFYLNYVLVPYLEFSSYVLKERKKEGFTYCMGGNNEILFILLLKILT